jgi:hypothetical protein
MKTVLNLKDTRPKEYPQGMTRITCKNFMRIDLELQKKHSHKKKWQVNE